MTTNTQDALRMALNKFCEKYCFGRPELVACAESAFRAFETALTSQSAGEQAECKACGDDKAEELMRETEIALRRALGLPSTDEQTIPQLISAVAQALAQSPARQNSDGWSKATEYMDRTKEDFRRSLNESDSIPSPSHQ